MIRGEIIEDDDITFARPGPTVEYWEGEE